eukprot:6341432-Pyramimonas_sp.AAC.1
MPPARRTPSLPRVRSTPSSTAWFSPSRRRSQHACATPRTSGQRKYRWARLVAWASRVCAR